MENSSTIDPYNSAITRQILKKKISFLKVMINMKILSSKQEEEFKTTTFVINILQSNQVKRFAQESRFGFVQNLNPFFTPLHFTPIKFGYSNRGLT